jgi:hypothetical protein
MTTTKSNPWRDHEGEVDDLTPWNMTESFTTIVLAYVDGFNDKTFVDYVKFVCDMFRERPAGQPFQEAMRWICMFASAKRREDFVNPRPWDDIHCGNPAPDEGGNSVFFFHWAEAGPNGAHITWKYNLRTKKVKLEWRASEKYKPSLIADLICWDSSAA